MTALIENGEDWMAPLLKFRNELTEGRNVSENRSSTRRNGMVAVHEDGYNFGNYEASYRAKLLRQLLEIQKGVQETKPHITLITNQELIAIQVIWNRDGEFEYNISDIYKKVYDRDLSTNNMKSLGKMERRILKEVCEDSNEYYSLIDQLISLQESKTLMVAKLGLNNDLEMRIENFVKEQAL